MAVEKYFYLDKAGLSQYDGLIKQYVNAADALAIKYITYDTLTNPTQLNFWKVDPTSSGAQAAYTVTFPDASTLMTKVSGSHTGELVELDANGQVIATGIDADDVLTKLATGTANAIVIAAADGSISRSSVVISDIIKKSDDTGATFTAGQWAVFDSDGDVKGLDATAANVSYSNTNSGLTATDVQAAIDEVAAQSAGGVESKTVYITETAGGSGDLYSKRYGIYQGDEGSAQDPESTELLANIDIPKDMVIESGSVVDITYSAGHLYDGSTDVTEIIKGAGGTATEADAGKYMKLVIANAASSVIYIAVKDLVDLYTVGDTADIDLSIDSNNQITGVLTTAVHDSLALADTSLQPVRTATEDHIVTFTSTGGIQDSGKTIADIAGGIEDVIAPAFSTSATYALGDYVIYNGKLYECTTAVTTAGAWVAGNWTESKVMTSFQPIPSAYIAGLFT